MHRYFDTLIYKVATQRMQKKGSYQKLALYVKIENIKYYI